MQSFLHSVRAGLFSLFIVVLMLTVTACNSGGGNGNGTPSPSSISFTVSGNMDTESQLLTQMYVLLLQHASFKVTEHSAFSTDQEVFKAITSSQIDLYPEFTATGLAKLGLNSTGNAQLDYLQIKQGYEAKYHITWLDAAPLNDTYGICTTQAKATSLGLTKISDLTSKAAHLTIAASADSVQHGVAVAQSVYGLKFQKVVTYKDEGQAFTAVASGAQDLNICHTTNAQIVKLQFAILQDNKNAYPVYNPAPIIRDSILKQAPQIAGILNKLAPLLTTQVSQQLQAEVIDGKSVTQVATSFLQKEGLL